MDDDDDERSLQAEGGGKRTASESSNLIRFLSSRSPTLAGSPKVVTFRNAGRERGSSAAEQ